MFEPLLGGRFRRYSKDRQSLEPLLAVGAEEKMYATRLSIANVRSWFGRKGFKRLSQYSELNFNLMQ
jgi:hypothetical protein